MSSPINNDLTPKYGFKDLVKIKDKFGEDSFLKAVESLDKSKDLNQDFSLFVNRLNRALFKDENSLTKRDIIYLEGYTEKFSVTDIRSDCEVVKIAEKVKVSDIAKSLNGRIIFKGEYKSCNDKPTVCFYGKNDLKKIESEFGSGVYAKVIQDLKNYKDGPFKDSCMALVYRIEKSLVNNENLLTSEDLIYLKDCAQRLVVDSEKAIYNGLKK